MFHNLKKIVFIGLFKHSSCDLMTGPDEAPTVDVTSAKS